MSELRTALDLAETWKDRRRMRRWDDAEAMAHQLAAIPADAARQIADLRAEVERLETELTARRPFPSGVHE